MPDQPTRGRREMLGKLLLGGGAMAAGGMACSNEERLLESRLLDSENNSSENPGARKQAAVSRRSRREWAKPDNLKEHAVRGTLCGLEMPRMFLGGNLVSGFAHARDLLYVSQLVLAYHTKEKIFATLNLAEACGIDMFLMNPSLCPMINEYWEKTGGGMRFMTNSSGKTPAKIFENIKKSIDAGASSCVLQGEAADRLVKETDFDTIARCVELIRRAKLPAGIAAHRLETLQGCVREGIRPDYWMKTFHHLDYWSAAKGKPEHDNVFCREPEETATFLNARPEPWIAFKVLAAGSIRPEDGFRFAIEGGADFLCVGMYDFQIVDDVNLFNDIYRSSGGGAHSRVLAPQPRPFSC